MNVCSFVVVMTALAHTPRKLKMSEPKVARAVMRPADRALMAASYRRSRTLRAEAPGWSLRILGSTRAGRSPLTPAERHWAWLTRMLLSCSAWCSGITSSSVSITPRSNTSFHALSYAPRSMNMSNPTCHVLQDHVLVLLPPLRQP